MGNKICSHPRVILTEDIALHFQSSHLRRDVLPIIDRWRADGSELGLRLLEFQTTFDVIKDLEAQFNAFDTKGTGRVDAHEVLMVYILLSEGDIETKVDAIFSIFDFAGCRGHAHRLNFAEAMIMMEACVKSVRKVCILECEITDDIISFYCKSLFDMHRVPHSERITRQQFKQWFSKEAAAQAFVGLFHEAQGLPDINAQVQKANLHQAQVFQMLAHGRLLVRGELLRASEDWRRSLHNATEEEVDDLVGLMEDSSGRIRAERYHAVLRAWNIFNECDLDGSGTVDTKEMEILLWIYCRKKQDPAFVKTFYEAVDQDGNGTVCRKEWVEAITQSFGAEDGDDTSVPGSISY